MWQPAWLQDPQGMTGTNAEPQLRAPIRGPPVWPWQAEAHRPPRGFQDMQKGLLLKYLMAILKVFFYEVTISKHKLQNKMKEGPGLL